MIIDLFSFYIGIVVQLFTNVLNRFEIYNGIGFGTFLLACSLFVVFINLIKFQYGSNGFQEIKSFRDKKQRNLDKELRIVERNYLRKNRFHR